MQSHQTTSTSVMMNRQRTRKLKICHLNAQSINNKIELLKNFLASAQVDIMLVNETWLNPSTNIVIENYKIVRNDRIQSRGGGVCIIIHNSICFSEINIPGSIGTESVTVRLHDCIRGKHDLLISSLYNPPQTNINSIFF